MLIALTERFSNKFLTCTNISDFFISEIGVRQGENLSPLLFSLFLNDLHTYLQNDNAVGVELLDSIGDTAWLKLLDEKCP